MAVVLVEHDMHLVMRTCATVHVLDFGWVLAVGTAAEVRPTRRCWTPTSGHRGGDAARVDR